MKIYLAIRFRYNGRNNGQICFSAREAGAVIHKSYSTGALALARLSDLGFIKLAQDSTFGQKRLSREYEITAIGLQPAQSKKTLPAGTKDFLRLTANHIAALDAQRGGGKKEKHSVMGKAHSVMGKNKTPKPARFAVVK